MSRIVGVLHFDGAQVDEAVLTRMNDASGRRDSGATRSVIRGPLGMGYRHFDTANKHANAAQPLIVGHFQIVLDGRIDNREEIRSLVAPSGFAVVKCSDPELVVLAFQQWGIECAERLIGEFAFALWDSKEQRLYCARDALGVKPFHYYQDSRVFLFASQIAPLLAHPRVSAQPNEGMIAEYACYGVTSRSETLYRGVLRLPPGHLLAVQSSGSNLKQYWNFRGGTDGLKKTDEEFAEEFLNVFSEVVRCRIADGCRPGFDLSGGLDSSSIVCVANRLTGWGSRLEGFSLAYDDPRADEREYVAEVARFAGVTANLVQPVDADVARIKRLAEVDRDFPGLPNLLMFDPVLQLMQQKDMRTRLTGLCGDHWLQGDFRHTADLVRALKFWSALRQCRSDSRVLADFSENVSPWKLFARHGLVPLLPAAIHDTLRFMLRRDGIPFWIEPQFAQKTALADRLKNPGGASPRFPTLVQNYLWMAANSGWLGLVLEMFDRHGLSFDVETRHPFLDRRLVEFCLALPEDQRWRGDQTKYVLRNATRGILPEIIRSRRTKGDFSRTFSVHLMTAEVRQALHSSAAASHGWLSQEGVNRMYSQFRSDYQEGIPNPRFIFPLGMIYGVESWLKSAF